MSSHGGYEEGWPKRRCMNKEHLPDPYEERGECYDCSEPLTEVVPLSDAERLREAVAYAERHIPREANGEHQHIIDRLKFALNPEPVSTPQGEDEG